jgi:hypothetical protein
MTPGIKRRGLLFTAVWIGTILVAGFLVWFLTQDLRTRFLVERINSELAGNGDSRRLETVLPKGRASGFGTWFSLTQGTADPAGKAGKAGRAGRAFVFTMMRGNGAAACVAFVNPSGAVETILPLSGNAAQILEELPEPVYHFYAGRIEKAARLRGPK